MRIAAVLPAEEQLSLSGGAVASNCREIFRRIGRRHQVSVYCRPGYDVEQPPELQVAAVLAAHLGKGGVLQSRWQRWYPAEVGLRLRGLFDVVYIFNRPQFVVPIRRWNPHAGIVLHMANDHLRDMDYRLCARALGAVDGVVCNSAHVLKGFATRFPEAREKARVVHNGVDTVLFRPANGPSAGGERTRKILFVGRLTEEKGAHFLVEAAKLVFRQVPDVNLEIVGSSWFGENKPTPYITALRGAAAPLGSRVVFRGYVRSDLVPEIYRSADVFVAPSVWSEPFGKMNLEAMASGLAVVSSPRGGIPEVVGDAGILCEPEDVSGLADRIIEVLTDDCLRITLGQRARERAETLFTWDRAVAGIEEILRSLSCH
ncbi:MAG TPA: glycosyltransferase family 4 protein [Methylomirabilota bacterium]